MTQFRASGFQTLSPVIKNLLIINGLVFLAQNTVGLQYINMEKWFALHTWQSPWFKPWQIVTHLFMHGDFAHIFFNMFALWMFGSVLENLWGAKRFLIFYFACGLGAALTHLTFLYFDTAKAIHDYELMRMSLEDAQQKLFGGTIGASGAVFGCLAAFGYLFPNSELYVYGLIPVKAKWMVLGYAALELYLAVQNSSGDNVAHIAHLGGAVVGFVLVYFWNKTNKRSFY
jgi:membrane associated rhomboid family serine protease